MDEPEFQLNGFCMRLRSYQWGQFVVQSKLQVRGETERERQLLCPQPWRKKERERPPSSHALAKKKDPLVLNPAERKRERERETETFPVERERDFVDCVVENIPATLILQFSLVIALAREWLMFALHSPLT